MRIEIYIGPKFFGPHCDYHSRQNNVDEKEKRLSLEYPFPFHLSQKIAFFTNKHLTVRILWRMLFALLLVTGVFVTKKLKKVYFIKVGTGLNPSFNI